MDENDAAAAVKSRSEDMIRQGVLNTLFNQSGMDGPTKEKIAFFQKVIDDLIRHEIYDVFSVEELIIPVNYVEGEIRDLTIEYFGNYRLELEGEDLGNFDADYERNHMIVEEAISVFIYANGIEKRGGLRC